MSKRQGMMILSIMTIMVFSLFTTGCQKAGEETAEKIIESATGGKVDIDSSDDSVTIKTDSGVLVAGGAQEWPDKIPSYLPKFGYGKITSVMENNDDSGQHYFIGLSEVTAENFNAYQSEVEGAGWSVTTTSKAEDGMFFMASKDKDALTVSFSKEDAGFSGGISYNQVK